MLKLSIVSFPKTSEISFSVVFSLPPRKRVKGLTLNGQLAFDKGELAGGDNFGVLLSVKYNGLFDIFKR